MRWLSRIRKPESSWRGFMLLRTKDGATTGDDFVKCRWRDQDMSSDDRGNADAKSR